MYTRQSSNSNEHHVINSNEHHAICRLYKKLLKHFGPQNWWPADEPFEVVVGAVLTQRTSWKNVELAIKNLKSAAALSPEKIAGMSSKKLERLIRPSGFYKQKAQRLKEVAKFLIENGGIDALEQVNTADLREKLLAIKGVGKETADSILLYAFDKPVFVVDAYTYRIFERAGITEKKTSTEKKMSYDELRTFIEELLGKDEKPDRCVSLYKEFHALIVQLGKTYCKSRPLCNECPVKCVGRTG